VFERLLQETFRTEWVVYVKPPFENPEHVLTYLARYTHRLAISNHRIRHIDDESVTFRYKDYRRSRARSLTLSLAEFTRRFLLHVLPKGFVRIRHYGFLANAARARMLPLCRRAILAQQVQVPADPPLAPVDKGSREESRLLEGLLPKQLRLCPHCGKRALRRVEILARPPPPQRRGRRVAA